MELEGTWGREYGWYSYYDLYIDNNGNITLFCSEYASYKHTYTYIGKIENNFEYPYTVKITQTSFYRDRKLLTDSYYNEHTGTIKFDNASSCSVDFYAFYGASGRWVNISGVNLNFIKQ